MGSVKVTNSVLSDTYKSSETRLLIIDDHQLRYNQIIDIFKNKGHQVHAVLLDDLSSFEKQLNFEWDMVIFARAYDLKVQQATALIQASKQSALPLLMFRPESYHNEDYTHYIQRGVYELVDLNHPEHFYIIAARALAYSRLLQNERRLGNELQQAQSHAQNLVQERSQAQATIQEGIHVAANPEYLQLFGLNDENDIIGLPLLDLLQPNDLAGFKQRFKKISSGQFEQAQLELQSLNPHLHAANPLKIEFLPSEEADSLQISIQSKPVETSNLGAQPLQSIAPDMPTPSSSSSAVNNTVAALGKHLRVNALLEAQTHSHSALVLITLAKCPELVFQDDWHTFKNYFVNTYNYLKDQLPFEVLRVDSAAYVAVISAESSVALQQRLANLAKFEQQQLINVNNTTMPLHLRWSWYSFKAPLKDAAQLEGLLAQAFNQRLPASMTASVPSQNHADAHVILPEPELNVVSLTAEHIEQAKTQTPLLFNLEQAVQKNEIVLKYQQLYDKQDSNLYMYEVTAGFNDDQGWHDISDLNDLNEDSELSIQVDRWILVEACKQLHNFIQKHPSAKIIVNLNQHILYQDDQFAELIAKLLTIVASKQEHPLVLQFSEQAAVKNVVVATQQFEKLSLEGAEISIREAGASGYTEQILKNSKVHFLTMAAHMSQKLSSDLELDQLQQVVDAYMSLQPVDVLLGELNDMNMFANAWSVNARYLRGEYFQKKMDRLVDVQDQ